MKNTDIREYARNKNVYLWEVADFLKIADMTLSKRLRYELTEEEKAEYYKAIDTISKNHEREG